MTKEPNNFTDLPRRKQLRLTLLDTHDAIQYGCIRMAVVIDVLESITGGAERQIYELAKQLNSEKFKLYLFVIHGERIPDEFKNLSIEAKALGLKRVYGTKGIREGFKFAYFLKKNKIDLVMTYHFSSDVWGVLFAKWAGVKSIISNRRDIGFWRKRTHVFAYKIINRWVSVIMGNSNAVVKMIQEEERVLPNRTKLLYNGIDLNRFDTSTAFKPRPSGRGKVTPLSINPEPFASLRIPRRIPSEVEGQTPGFGSTSSFDKLRTSPERSRGTLTTPSNHPEQSRGIRPGCVEWVDFSSHHSKVELGLPIDSQLIGCLGNLKAVKGQNFLLEAAVELIKNNQRLYFIFIGGDEWGGFAQAYVKQLGIEMKVHFLDKRNDIPQLLSIMDICVLPSLSEGFSNALLEYMAAGKPIVATAVGGNIDVIEHEKNGLLVPSRDAKALEEAILRLLEDKPLAQTLAHNARKTVEERFEMKKQIREFEEFLESLVNANACRNIRIMHLISSNGLFGAEKVLLELVRQQREQRMAVCLGVFNNKHNPHLEIADEVKKLGIEVVIFDCAGQFDFGTVVAIRKNIRERAVNIIHSHGYKANFYAWFATWFLKTKRLATYHGRTDKPCVKMYQCLDAFVLSRFHRVVLVSEALREKLTRSGVKDNRLAVIPNGININAISTLPPLHVTSALRQEFNVPLHSPLIGIIGRASLEKGHRYLFEALLDIRCHISDVKCLVVGDGELLNELKTMVRDRGLDTHVVFTGVRNNIPEILNMLDVFVMPSLTEGTPLALLEAMAAKVPIVATKVGGVPSIIEHGFSGLLVEPRDVRSLAQAIGELLQNSEKANSMAQHAFEKVAREYSAETMAKKYKGVYDSCIVGEVTAKKGSESFYLT